METEHITYINKY